MNGHHGAEEFTRTVQPADDELIVYTWRDATLKELSLLVRDVLNSEGGEGGNQQSNAYSKDLKFSFRLVYPDPMRGGRFVTKDIGWVVDGGISAARQLQLQEASEKTLDDVRFVTGDFVDVAIYTSAAMIPRPVMNSGPTRGRGQRWNGPPARTVYRR